MKDEYNRRLILGMAIRALENMRSNDGETESILSGRTWKELFQELIKNNPEAFGL